MSVPTLAFDSALAAVHGAGAWYVVVAGDIDDWVMRFDDVEGEFAEESARNVIAVFNDRLARERK